MSDVGWEIPEPPFELESLIVPGDYVRDGAVVGDIGSSGTGFGIWLTTKCMLVTGIEPGKHILRSSIEFEFWRVEESVLKETEPGMRYYRKYDYTRRLTRVAESLYTLESAVTNRGKTKKVSGSCSNVIVVDSDSIDRYYLERETEDIRRVLKEADGVVQYIHGLRTEDPFVPRPRKKDGDVLDLSEYDTGWQGEPSDPMMEHLLADGEFIRERVVRDLDSPDAGFGYWRTDRAHIIYSRPYRGTAARMPNGSIGSPEPPVLVRIPRLHVRKLRMDVERHSVTSKGILRDRETVYAVDVLTFELDDCDMSFFVPKAVVDEVRKATVNSILNHYDMLDRFRDGRRRRPLCGGRCGRLRTAPHGRARDSRIVFTIDALKTMLTGSGHRSDSDPCVLRCLFQRFLSTDSPSSSMPSTSLYSIVLGRFSRQPWASQTSSGRRRRAFSTAFRIIVSVTSMPLDFEYSPTISVRRSTAWC